MDYLLNSQEMKQCDKTAIEHYGIPSAVLMERAALSVFAEITKRFPDKTGKILAVCGAGNNGGDGIAIARLLHLSGYQVEIVFPMDKARMTNETKAQYKTAEKYGIPIGMQNPELLSETSYTVIIDALFGIGLSRAVEEPLSSLLEALNKNPAYKTAVDIPSGISADSGKILGTAFRADLTVTFGFAKTGQLLYPAAEYIGKLVVADIGIDAYCFLDQKPPGRYLNPKSAYAMLPERTAYSNKGSYGKTLIVAGSKDMAGAAYFAAKAAYLSGCGLVRILTPKENRQILFTKLPEALLTVYDAQTEDMDSLRQTLQECMEWADAVLIGPGIGNSPAARLLTEKALQCPEKKMVLDADALNILSTNLPLWKESTGEKVITPHLKEMSRLSQKSVAEIQDSLIQTALDFAETHDLTCILKDARTVTAMPDGTFFINDTGNHGMATGGSGDVLSGFLAGFLAQGIPCEAIPLAVFLHGTAGDIVSKKKGSRSMTASDLLEALPKAIRQIEKQGTKKQV